MSSLAKTRNRGPASICLACGLCCDGTIFSDVKLVAGDDPETLGGLGLPLVKGRSTRGKGDSKGQTKFRQPCSALEGCRCRIYGSRPGYCRQFECLLLKKLQAGRVTRREALETIRAARSKAREVAQLLRGIGDTDEAMALPDRFRRTTRRLLSTQSGPETAELYGRLTLAFHELNLLIHDQFYRHRS